MNGAISDVTPEGINADGTTSIHVHDSPLHCVDPDRAGAPSRIHVANAAHPETGEHAAVFWARHG